MATCFGRIRGHITKPRMRQQHVAPRFSVGYAARLKAKPRMRRQQKIHKVESESSVVVYIFFTDLVFE